MGSDPTSLPRLRLPRPSSRPCGKHCRHWGFAFCRSHSGLRIGKCDCSHLRWKWFLQSSACGRRRIDYRYFLARDACAPQSKRPEVRSVSSVHDSSCRHRWPAYAAWPRSRCRGDRDRKSKLRRAHTSRSEHNHCPACGFYGRFHRENAYKIPLPAHALPVSRSRIVEGRHENRWPSRNMYRKLGYRVADPANGSGCKCRWLGRSLASPD